MAYKDLRGFLHELEEHNELGRVEGAHWDLEVGAITELVARNQGPALLFDKIRDYPQGYRVATLLLNAIKGSCLAAQTREKWKDFSSLDKGMTK